MAYLLDANVFIEAKNRFYGLDFCPAFWDWLTVKNGEGRVFSIEKISDEINAGDDALTEWARDRDDGFFLRPDPPVGRALGQANEWVIEQGYDPAGITTFMEGADCYLVAQALAAGHDVVTLETPSASRKKVKIPNVCIGLGIRCMTPFEMLRNEHARFVLGPQS